MPCGRASLAHNAQSPGHVWDPCEPEQSPRGPAMSAQAVAPSANEVSSTIMAKRMRRDITTSRTGVWVDGAPCANRPPNWKVPDFGGSAFLGHP
jgi:hypothetical protein